MLTGGITDSNKNFANTLPTWMLFLAMQNSDISNLHKSCGEPMDAGSFGDADALTTWLSQFDLHMDGRWSLSSSSLLPFYPCILMVNVTRYSSTMDPMAIAILYNFVIFVILVFCHSVTTKQGLAGLTIAVPRQNSSN